MTRLEFPQWAFPRAKDLPMGWTCQRMERSTPTSSRVGHRFTALWCGQYSRKEGQQTGRSRDTTLESLRIGQADHMHVPARVINCGVVIDEIRMDDSCHAPNFSMV